MIKLSKKGNQKENVEFNQGDRYDYTLKTENYIFSRGSYAIFKIYKTLIKYYIEYSTFT